METFLQQTHVSYYKNMVVTRIFLYLFVDKKRLYRYEKFTWIIGSLLCPFTVSKLKTELK